MNHWTISLLLGFGALLFQSSPSPLLADTREEMFAPLEDSDLGLVPKEEGLTDFSIPEGLRVDYEMDVVLVEFDVSVHSKRGNFISGLTRDHFRVLEDGKEVPITYFEEVVRKNDAEQGLKINGPGRSFLVFVDNYLSSTRKAMQVRKALQHFIREQIVETDKLSLAILDPFGRMSVAVEVSRERALQMARDMSVPNGRFQGAISNSYDQARLVLAQVQESVDTVLDLGANPRTLIFLSPGFVPVAPERTPSIEEFSNIITSALAPGQGPGVRGPGIPGAIDPLDPFAPTEPTEIEGDRSRKSSIVRDNNYREHLPSIDGLMNSLTGWLNKRNITLFSINCGEYSPLDLLGTFSSRVPLGADSANYQGLELPQTLALDMKLNTLRAMAELTGGLAWMNPRSFRKAFHNIDQATSVVYKIGFQPANPGGPRAFHTIQVEIDKKRIRREQRIKRVKLRFPRGYLDG